MRNHQFTTAYDGAAVVHDPKAIDAVREFEGIDRRAVRSSGLVIVNHSLNLYPTGIVQAQNQLSWL